ncbi:hypothetical protein Calla_1844 [Caldicellulosiruptor acetigenus 6A]|uniref:Uncharacterized protein n=1 Tax=Caldicellulosiruptor acetigenus 6A TaxID=632516 RepID=G2PUF3_9FIRM|nr:hypothetical protein Calla_1844 [Caldicellulosiruptor acetigenus 6A]
MKKKIHLELLERPILKGFYFFVGKTKQNCRV